MKFPPEKLRKPARAFHAGAVRQFSTNQVDSTEYSLQVNNRAVNLATVGTKFSTGEGRQEGLFAS